MTCSKHKMMPSQGKITMPCVEKWSPSQNFHRNYSAFGVSTRAHARNSIGWNRKWRPLRKSSEGVVPFRTGGRNRTRTCQKRHRHGILERVETEREGVKTERLVHFMWQAQHCGSVTCKEMVRYDTSMYTWQGVPLWRRSKPERGAAWSISRGSRSTFDHVLWCFPEKWFDIPSKPFPPPQSPP